MKQFIKKGLLVLALSAPFTVQAAGSSPPTGSQPGNGSDSANTLITLGLNLAIAYAKMDPKYATILNTLQINTAEDLLAFLKGNGDGTNFKNIVARLAFLEAQKNPKAKAALAALGIKTELDLRNFLKNGSGSSMETVLNLALVQAMANPKYAVWLQRLNIRDVQDLRNFISGSGRDGNLRSLILVVALNYVNSKPKYQKYVPIIQAVMATYGINIGSDGTGSGNTSDDDIIDLGAFSGMTVGESRAVRQLR